MAKTKADILIDLFLESRKASGRIKPLVNRNSAHFVIKEILKDLSMDQAKELFKFFGAFYNEDFKWFGYNYDTVWQKYENNQQIKERDLQVMRESEERTKKWKERVNRIAGT